MSDPHFSADTIVTWLTDHPEVAQEVAVRLMPSGGGKVVSIQDSLNRRLQQESRKLRDQLHSILQQARRNEAIQRRFESIEQGLSQTRGLDALLGYILFSFESAFDLKTVSITLIDPPSLLQAYLQEDGHRRVLCRARREFEVLGPGRMLERTVLMSEPQISVLKLLFPDWTGVASLAVLPLRVEDRLIGTINLGSPDPDHYIPDQGSEMLDRIGQLIALALDHALVQEQLIQRHLIDPVSHLVNRQFLDWVFPCETSRWPREGFHLGLAILDMDRFEPFNQRWGEAEGDQMLRRIIEQLLALTTPTEWLVRMSGQRFAVLFVDHEAEAMTQLLQEGIKAIAAIGSQHPGAPRLTASAGLSLLQDQEDLDEWIRRTEEGLYLAKTLGGDRIEWA